MQGILKNKWLCIVVLLTLVVSGQGILADVSPDNHSMQIVSLSNILEKPDSWLGMNVKIALRFAWISEVYVPFRTLFTSSQFMNFTAWDVQSHIWTREGFEDPHPYFYMERDSRKMKDLLKLKTFDTICVIGKVESIFAGKPFIRVVWMCTQPGNLSVTNLKMIHTSMKHFKDRQFDQAISGFAKIVLTEPPDDIKIMLHKLTAKIYMYEKKSFEPAMQELHKAKAISPKDSEVEELLLQCNQYIKHGIVPIPVVQKPVVKKTQALKTAQPGEEKKSTPEIESEGELGKKTEKIDETKKEVPAPKTEPMEPMEIE